MELSEETKDQLRYIRLPENYWFDTIDQIQKLGLDISKWFEDPKSKVKGKGLYIFGEYGVGKSSIAAIIAKMCLARGVFSLWINSRDLPRYIINDTMFSESMTMLERAEEVDLLIIDEFHPQAKNSDFPVKVIDDLVRTRVQSNKATIITSNLSPTTLKEDSKVKGLCGSLVEILREACSPLLVTGENLRKKEIKKETK